MVRIALTVIVLTLAMAGCRKLGDEQCKTFCWRFNELNYWDKFEKETADLDKEAKDAERIRRREKWNEMAARKFDPGLDNCVKDCRRRGTPDQYECMESAKTASEARACMD